MPNLRIRAILAGLSLSMAGCGTMANLDGRKAPLLDLPHQEAPKPFGGVGRDFCWITDGAVFFVADLPFSLVGDLVTLPRVLRTPAAGREIREARPIPTLLPLARPAEPLAADQPPRSPSVPEDQVPMPWPQDWSKVVGQRVTVEGVAVNQKVGAALWGEGRTIFIDGVHSWPEGYYFGGEQGRRLQVSGTVVERHDLPVFIPRKGEPAIQGIPVPEGTDLHQASQRFLLQHVRWAVVE